MWDSLLFEGTKILFRVSLALLKLHEEQLLQMDNAGDLINQLRMYTTHIHDRDRLMKVRRPLPQAASHSRLASTLE